MILEGLMTSAVASVAGKIVDKIIGPFTDLAKKFIDKQITEAQLHAEMVKLLVSSVADVEKTDAQSISQNYSSLMSAVERSKTVARTWAFVVVSETFVLIWHQFFIPLLVTFHFFGITQYASSGTTTNWAYLLVTLCLGAGVFGLHSGPGRINMSSWKTLIGK